MILGLSFINLLSERCSSRSKKSREKV